MRMKHLLALAFCGLALTGCSGSGSESRDAAALAPGEVAELRSLDTLKDAFAAGEGHPRVLLLLSPT